MATDSCRDFSGFPHDMRKNAEQCDEDIIKRKGEGETGLRLPGQGCSKLIEPLPTFDKMECEVVYPSDNGSDNNAYMVFGRDRHTRKALAGYGGYGCTSAGMIDLVVGRGGAAPKHQEIVGPNFFTDAARVYILICLLTSLWGSSRQRIDPLWGLRLTLSELSEERGYAWSQTPGPGRVTQKNLTQDWSLYKVMGQIEGSI